MKKVDPFSGIPAVPTSLAGQWLAFSHMANHYRKLLNVKPRVDTSAPRGSSTHLTPSLSYYLKGHVQPPTKPKKIVKKLQQGSKTLVTSRETHEYLQQQTLDYNDSFDSPESSPRTSPKLQTKKRISGNKPKGKYLNEDFNIETIDYQVVFGPSSIKSSTDAMVSDCESQPDQPKVEVMGVAEKIKVFLDQLHEFDNRNPNNVHNLSPKKLKASLTKTNNNPPLKSKPAQAQLNSKSKANVCNDCNQSTIDARLSRHSKCFLPCSSNSATGSPKKTASIKKKIGTTTVPSKTAPISSNHSSNNKKLLSEALSKAKELKSNSSQSRIRELSGYEAVTGLSALSISNDGRRKNTLGKGVKKRYISGGSVGSVGTIRGSDELTAEDMLIMPLPHNYHQTELENLNLVKNVKNSPSAAAAKQRNKSGILRNTRNSSSAGYCSQSLSGKATSLSSLGVGMINNKDSSRDSAYGFSSGESRITTRESTPEKMKSTITTHHHPHKSRNSNNADSKSSRKSSDKNKNSKGGQYKTALSTVASSVNLDSMPGKEGHQCSAGKRDIIKAPSEDKYLNFLTEITEDIVSRGIYTNKGLKILFKAHMEHHRGLDSDKMAEMLDKLRMDLGIPKDDTLNKLEFGYGSVLYSTDSYSYTDLENKRNNANLLENQPIIYPLEASSFPTNHKSKSLSRKSERTRLIDERAGGEVSRPSETHKGFQNPCDEVDLQSSKSDASTALSETELRLTLKEVGIDIETTLEIVEMMNPTRMNPINVNKSKKEMSSDDSDLWPSSPSRLNKPSRLRDSSGEEMRRRQQSRSASPPSRYSTGSS